MQRYFVSPADIADQQIKITGDDVKHIVRVLRMQAGDEVIAADGQGHSYRVRLRDLQEEYVLADIIEQLDENREAEVRITLVQGLPKGDKMDLIVQKGTEVGVSTFAPVETRRTIVQYDHKKEAKRRERWQKIAKEAAEQSHRQIVPEVSPVVSLNQWIKEINRFDFVIVASESEQGTTLRELLDVHPNAKEIALLIGPEGGWDDSEIDSLVKAGVRSVTLGPRIMRTETAGLAGAVMILYHFGQMGG